jgi:hypothetical protein
LVASAEVRSGDRQQQAERAPRTLATAVSGEAGEGNRQADRKIAVIV